ncbi:MAG: glucosamine-6-phosphate deaminase [Candidatus Staskawiczbacteria bacterium]|nr:glucosamine-6-phosphate deaminase [Candidatus Staskawiczbacteria bacterium]
MEIYIEKDYNALSKRAANIIASFLKEKPNAVLGLPTGSTPIGTYKLLAKKCRNNEISFKKVKTFNLDEYSKISKEDKQSYHYFMNQAFFSKIGIKKENTFFPDNFFPYKKYDEKIDKNKGIDLQVLGIGRDGHIGFNEPGSKFNSKTREVFLAKETIEDNSRFFNNKKDVPRKAVTMGIGTIMKAKNILVIVSGKNKSEAVHRALEKEMSTKIPASILRKHKNVIVILDKDSAKKLDLSLDKIR